MPARDARNAAANFTAAFALTVSLFALWGLGHSLYDTLMPQVAAVFGLHGYGRALTQGLYSIMYIVGAIPAALCARRFGYTAAVLLGLGALCIGAFLLYPAMEQKTFRFFVTAVAMMSFGWIMLEVAANPLAASFGTVETSVRRLNLAQSFFPIGALAGVFVGGWLVSAHLAVPAGGARYSIVHPYILIGAGVLLLAFLFENTRFPPVASERVRGLKGVGNEFRILLTNRLFLFGVVAQFFSVLALAGTWSVGGRVFEAAFPGTTQITGGDVFIMALAAFAVGRFAGTALMYRFAPDRILAVFSGGGLVLASFTALTGGPAGAIATIASSFFLSITWPTVLGIAIRGLGPLMKLGTALVCMAGGVGGLAYQMMTVVWNVPDAHVAMIVPAVSYAALLAFAAAGDKARKSIAASQTGLGEHLAVG